MNVIFIAAVLLLPVLVLLILSWISQGIVFQWCIVCRLWISAVFLLIGGVHFISPAGVTELIPNFIPYQNFWSYLSGALEISLALLLWTRWQKPASAVMIAVLIAFLPFNIYGWTLPENSINYIEDPGYLWFRVPLQAVFILWAYFAVAPERRGRIWLLGGRASYFYLK